MTALITRPPHSLAPTVDPHFALDQDGMPVYLGETEDEIGNDWDEISASIEKDHWKLAAIAATVATKYGENNVGAFAQEHGCSSRWIRELANAYRTFQFGNRVPNLSITHHICALKAVNPVRAAKIAHDRNYSIKDFKAWIYKGEGRTGGRLERNNQPALPPAPSANDQPIQITVEAEDPDSEEDISIEDEELDAEERQTLFADLELIMRMCKVVLSKLETKYAARYIENLEQEANWEVERLTQKPSSISERVLAYIKGGCWLPDELLKRARLNSKEELNRICRGLEKAGHIKWSRERKRQHGTAPAMWMPADMPDGDEFNVERTPYELQVEYDEEHF